MDYLFGIHSQPINLRKTCEFTVSWENSLLITFKVAMNGKIVLQIEKLPNPQSQIKRKPLELVKLVL